MRAFTLFIVLTAATAARGGGTSLGNGGGLGEQRMVYAWQELPRLLDLCAHIESCSGILGAETLVDEFLLVLRQSYAQAPLHFLTTASGNFPIDPTSGLPVLIYAGTTPGDPVDVNIDQLITRVNNIPISYITLSDGLFAIVAALGQAAHFDPQQVAVLGRATQALSESSVKTTDLSIFGRPEVTIVAFGDQLSFGDEKAIYNFSPATSATCSAPDEMPTNLVLGLFRWSQLNIPYDASASIQILRAQGDATWQCTGADGHWRPVSAQLVLAFDMKVDTSEGASAGPTGSDWQFDALDIVHFVEGSQQFQFVNIQEGAR